ncbi:hypothetical protein MG1601_582 [Mycoplasmoides gallisepticum]|uniref:hypothetical protein n=1 Tax=Mycoplasmoides gallisepticum TaxID=2096 RepID=UPI00334759F4
MLARSNKEVILPVAELMYEIEVTTLTAIKTAADMKFGVAKIGYEFLSNCDTNVGAACLWNNTKYQIIKLAPNSANN